MCLLLLTGVANGLRVGCVLGIGSKKVGIRYSNMALLEQNLLLAEYGTLLTHFSSQVEYNPWPGTHQDISSQMSYLCISVINKCVCVMCQFYYLFFKSIHHSYLSLFKKEICCV